VKVSELGEFGLIARLAEVLASQDEGGFAGRLVAGIGEDAAVWRADGSALIATTDTLVEGVHFLAGRTPWRDLGWKALAVNVSDVAAMGGTPELALVTLALPPDAEADNIEELYRGLAEAGAEYRVAIGGGDVVRAPQVSITVALLGRAELDETGEAKILRRDGARAGDLVAVTGALGGASGGLRALRAGAEPEAARPLIARHLRPRARVASGRAAVAAGVRCAIDVSDGLLQDLGHVCRASGLGAVVWRDKLPIEAPLAALFGDEDALGFAATGGEDYELLLAGSQEQLEQVRREGGVPVTIIGEMVIDAAHEAKLLDEHGREVALHAQGWDHLRGHG
jgi:thiamine-monophosphate kinase